MFYRIIMSNVKKELEKVDFKINGELSVLKICDDANLIHYSDNEKNLIIKYYNNDDNKVNNYFIMEKYGIKTIDYDVKSNRLILFDDIEYSSKYRLANADDLKDERVIAGLAKWYKELHNFDSCSCMDYTSYFTLDNLKKVINKFRLGNNETLLYIYNNFNNIKLKVDRLDKCLNYGEFSLKNMVVSKDYTEVFMVDFDNVCRGYRYNDIESIIKFIGEDNEILFFNKYGEIKEDEKIIGFVVSCVIGLYFATLDDKYCEKIKDVLENINNGKLLEFVRCLVNWY